MTAPIEPTPVTVIGGYLGAGKTTLINRLLTGGPGRRLAVLVNDFGAVNIDVDLITSHDGRTIGLENGCVCCSIADSLGDALDTVLAIDPPPEQIVIEASGVADPAKIANYGRGWPGCRLDAVIVVADATEIRDLADDRFVGELVTRQLGGGDLIALTKTDLLAADDIIAVEQWITGVVGGGVTVLRSTTDGLDPRVLLDCQIEGAIDGEIDSATGLGPTVSDYGQRAADELFESAVIDLPDAADQRQIAVALERWPGQVIRVKGFFTDLDGIAHRVQRVGRRWSIEPVADAAPVVGENHLLVIALRGSLPVDDLPSDLVGGEQHDLDRSLAAVRASDPHRQPGAASPDR